MRWTHVQPPARHHIPTPPRHLLLPSAGFLPSYRCSMASIDASGNVNGRQDPSRLYSAQLPEPVQRLQPMHGRAGAHIARGDRDSTTGGYDPVGQVQDDGSGNQRGSSSLGRPRRRKQGPTCIRGSVDSLGRRCRFGAVSELPILQATGMEVSLRESTLQPLKPSTSCSV